MKTNILYLFLISVAFFSCKTQSDIAYFQDLENKYDQGIAIDTLLNYESKIIPDDILSIYVSAEEAFASLKKINVIEPDGLKADKYCGAFEVWKERLEKALA